MVATCVAHFYKYPFFVLFFGEGGQLDVGFSGSNPRTGAVKLVTLISAFQNKTKEKKRETEVKTV